jgi:hypothetical protein
MVRLISYITGWIFTQKPFVIPARRLRETKTFSLSPWERDGVRAVGS